MTRLNPKIKNFLVTGAPGCGKTTILLNIKKYLESQGFRAGGCLTTEIRERGRRVGFSICDLASREEGILAHIAVPSKKRVGRYGVNLVDLERIGVEALKKSQSSNVDFVIIDEIGSMELFSLDFQDIVWDLLGSSKVVLGSIHYRSQHKFLQDIRRRQDTEIIEIDKENRNPMQTFLITKILRLLTL